MDFGLSEDQELLQRSARDFLAQECPTAFVRELAKSEDGFSRTFHDRLASMGWTGLVIAENYGGLGLGMLDLAVLSEEMGRAVMPGPFFSATLTSIALGASTATAVKKLWLPRLCDGDAIGTLAFLEENERIDAEGITLKCQKTRSGFRLTGSKLFVLDANIADVLLVAARGKGKGEEGVVLLAVPRDTPGITITPLVNVDLTRKTFEVEFDAVEVAAANLVAAEGKGWKILARTLDAAAILLAADGLGGSQRVLELSVEYSKVRQQFGRPIGSFQAVKHIAAEMASEIEPSRSLVWYAAYAFDAEPRQAARAAAMAKARLSDVYSRSTNRAVQIHGGIGFTWEHDMHLWFKRAKWNELSFGDPAYHRERLAVLDGF